MSKHLRVFLSELFGSSDGADCCVCFHVAAQDPQPQLLFPRPIVKTLPAHQLILRGGSERFGAHIERWARFGPQGDRVSLYIRAGSTGEGTSTVRVRLLLHSAHEPAPCPFDPNSKPLPNLLVPLESDDELQPSIEAIRFIYTGSLAPRLQAEEQQQGQGHGQQKAQMQGRGEQDGCGVAEAGFGVGELVRIRRQAEYLRVHGCAEACDEALEEWFAPMDGSDAGDGSSSASSGSPLGPVLELYSCRHLLPSEEEDARVGSVLSACCQYLALHWAEPLTGEEQGEEGPGGEEGEEGEEGSRQETRQGGDQEEGQQQQQQDLCAEVEEERAEAPSKAEILAWLLGGDAARIVNDAELTVLWYSLPAAALEELLQSDHLSTDDEATVVLLVEMWVAAQGSDLTEADKARVRRQLRLVNCSTSYLFDVLPKLPWLAAEEAALLARCRLSSKAQWGQLISKLGAGDKGKSWYSGKPRPQSVPGEGVSYPWEVSREDLLAGLKKNILCSEVIPSFVYKSEESGGCSVVTALGYHWGLQVQHVIQSVHAGVYLRCEVPEAITKQVGMVHGAGSLSARVEVEDGARGKHVIEWEDDVLDYSTYWGLGDALPLETAAASSELPPGGEAGGSSSGNAGKGQSEEQASGQGAVAEADEEAALLAPWAKLLGREGKIRGVLTIFGSSGKVPQAPEGGG